MKRVLIIIAAVVVVVILVSVLSPRREEIPITTKSEEARQAFLNGRQQLENLRADEAREYFMEAIELDPDFALAHLYRAFTGTSARDFRKHLREAAALSPQVSDGERLLIEATRANADNNPLEAVMLFERLLERYPEDKRAHFNLATAYFGREEYDKAIAGYTKALELDQDYAPAYNSLGYAYNAKEEYGKAEGAFQDYIRLLPGEANPHDSLADLYTKMGRHEEAIEHYQKALDLNPMFAFSQRKIGTNLVFMGKYEEARAAYHEAMEREATPAGKVIDLRMVARSHLYEGKHREALAAADTALAAAAESNLPAQIAQIHGEKCRIYIEAGDLKKAEESLAESEKAVMASDLAPAIKENFAKAVLFDAARIAAKRKDFDTAMSKAEEYKNRIEAGQDPKEMENHHMLVGYLALEKGDYEQALEHLKQADQDDPYTLYLLALAESEAGDPEKAASLMRQLADWNQNSLNYAFVRPQALLAAQKEMAIEE